MPVCVLAAEAALPEISDAIVLSFRSECSEIEHV